MRLPDSLRPLSLVVLAALACAAGYGAYWYTGTKPMRQPQPEMEWLRREFKLSQAQFEAVQKLDQAYAPRCAELCARVSASQAKLAALAAKGEPPGPALDEAVAECARVEADCRKNMLAHLSEVSLNLPAGQRERFLAQMTHRLLRPTPLDQVTGTPTPAVPAAHPHE